MVALQSIRRNEFDDLPSRDIEVPDFGSRRGGGTPIRGGRSPVTERQPNRVTPLRNGGEPQLRSVPSSPRVAPLRPTGAPNLRAAPDPLPRRSLADVPFSRSQPLPIRRGVPAQPRTTRSPSVRNISPINQASTPLRPEQLQGPTVTEYGTEAVPYRVRRTVELYQGPNNPWLTDTVDYPVFSPNATYQGPISISNPGPQYTLGPGGQRGFTWQLEVRNTTTGQLLDTIGIVNGNITAEQWNSGMRGEDFARNIQPVPFRRLAPDSPFVPDPGVTRSLAPPQRSSPLPRFSPQPRPLPNAQPLVSPDTPLPISPSPYSPSPVPSTTPYPLQNPRFTPTTPAQPSTTPNPAFRPYPAPNPGYRPQPGSTPGRVGQSQPRSGISPFPSTSSRPAPQPQQQPGQQPEQPNQCPPICSEPCIQEILAKVRSTDNKIDRLEQWLRELFETQETVRMSVTSIAPDSVVWQGEAPPNDSYNTPPYQLTETITLPRFQALLAALKQADELNDYRNRQIRNTEQTVVAAVPEHWQVRSPQVSQACFLLADLDENSSSGLGRSRWSLSIPHYRHDSTFRPNLQFQKGSHFGSMKLTDGSQVIVNCVDANECRRVLNEIQDLIDPEYIPDTQQILLSERSGQSLSEKTVKAIRITFHSNGQASLTPDWITYLQ